MSPYEIEIILHYYAHVDDHPEMTRDASIWRQTMERFIREGLVSYLHESERDAEYPRCYQITERGTAYCRALQCVPLPESVWSMPTFQWELTR